MRVPDEQWMGNSLEEATPAVPVPGFIDTHCHCLPDLDDGPGSVAQAVALCQALVCDHVETVVATPHQLGRYEGRATPQAIRTAVQFLNDVLEKRAVNLRVVPGAEVRLDERIPQLLRDDRLMTIADRNRHILLELPASVFIDIEPLLVDLRSARVEVIIAHPERNRSLPGQFTRLHQWLHEGARLQVTASSLTGRFGPAVQRVAWDLVARGWVAFVGTDAHNEQVNGPVMTAAFQMIATHLSLRMARRLCIENPSRLIEDGQLPVSALAFDEWGVG